MSLPLHHRLSSIGSILAAALLFFVIATASRAADRERLEAFLNVTGFDVALDSIALSAADAPVMLGMEASDFGSEWSRVADEVFDTDKMRELALDILSQTLSDDMLTHAASFYATPLGQRLVEVENISHMDEDTETRQKVGSAIVEEGGERVELLSRMNEAIDGANTAVRGVNEIQVRFLMAASHAGVLEVELDEQALRAAMKENEEELRASMRESGLVSSAYTYRDLSDDDILEYAKALEHPVMQRVYELMNAVQYEIMANRFEVLAGRMAGMTPGQEL